MMKSSSEQKSGKQPRRHSRKKKPLPYQHNLLAYMAPLEGRKEVPQSVVMVFRKPATSGIHFSYRGRPVEKTERPSV